MEVETSRPLQGEYVATFDATKEPLWLSQLACTLRQAKSNLALVVYSDSQGIVALSNNPIRHNISKYTDVRYHLVRY